MAAISRPLQRANTATGSDGLPVPRQPSANCTILRPSPASLNSVPGPRLPLDQFQYARWHAAAAVLLAMPILPAPIISAVRAKPRPVSIAASVSSRVMAASRVKLRRDASHAHIYNDRLGIPKSRHSTLIAAPPAWCPPPTGA